MESNATSELIEAVRNGDHKFCETLIALGADINMTEDEVMLQNIRIVAMLPFR